MSSGFITESEATEIRKKRQEEWERVRKADDPLERPEEPYDGRSLYEKLQEQKQKKDLEYEEAHKLKNMIKGLDDDEIEFLDLVDRTKLAADRKKELEEEQELNDYRNRVAQLQEQSIEQRIHSEIITNTKPKTNKVNSSKQNLLKGIVIKKNDEKKRKLSGDDTNEEKSDEPANKQLKCEGKAVFPSAMKCIGILPGMGCYEDSSSDEHSSDSEVEMHHNKIDLLGRKIEEKVVEKE